MDSVNQVYVARLHRMLVLGPMGESFGRVRDVVISISIVRQQPRVLGLVVDLATRRKIFIPILRVAAIAPEAVIFSHGQRVTAPVRAAAGRGACAGSSA